MRIVGANGHRFRYDPTELMRVDVLGLSDQAVAGSRRFDGALGQHATEPEDVRLQRRGVIGRQSIRPQEIDQAVGGDDRAPFEHESSEQLPLPIARWPGLVPGVYDPQRPEHPVPHVTTLSTWLCPAA
jgi:hypothetical protein